MPNRWSKTPFMLPAEAARGARVICEAGRTWSHLLTRRRSEVPPEPPPWLCRGLDHPNLIHGATVQPCRADCPGSPRLRLGVPAGPAHGVCQQAAKNTRPRYSGARIRSKYSSRQGDVNGLQSPFSLAISQGLSYSDVTAEPEIPRSIRNVDVRQGLGVLLFPSEPSDTPALGKPFGSRHVNFGTPGVDPASQHFSRASGTTAEEAMPSCS